jgi:hypothetical protein
MTVTNQQVIMLKQMTHKNNKELSAAKSGMSGIIQVLIKPILHFLPILH